MRFPSWGWYSLRITIAKSTWKREYAWISKTKRKKIVTKFYQWTSLQQKLEKTANCGELNFIICCQKLLNRNEILDQFHKKHSKVDNKSCNVLCLYLFTKMLAGTNVFLSWFLLSILFVFFCWKSNFVVNKLLKFVSSQFDLTFFDFTQVLALL